MGRAVYFASMASVGRKEVFIFLRLNDGQSDGTSWSLSVIGETDSGAPLGSV